MLRKVAALLLALLVVSPALGQEWARKMFKVTRHDFGTVARGAKIEFPFELSNIYLEDVHIANVRSSCSCTRPRIEKPLLKTYEKGAIVAAFNTKSFTGNKSATVTVTIDKPFRAEVQLHVKGHIRCDIVVEPGCVDLGSVDQGTSVERQVTISRTGRADWRILEVKSANPHLSAEAIETGRSFGRVTYNLKVRLAGDAPAGYVKDHLILLSNDRQATQIPVRVEGCVVAALSISPASLFMGVVSPGQKVTKRLVVRGKRPFRILAITCDDESFEFGTAALDGTAKPLHVVSVTFVAGEDSGRVSKTIRIQTDLDAAVPELSACAVVSAP